MQQRAVTWVVLVVGVAVVLVACADQSPSRRGREAAPQVGAVQPGLRAVPARRMDDLERQVARDLGARTEESGLALQHVDCPRWHGRVPARLTCRGWVDGLVARVRLRLSAAPSGHGVDFDASLGDDIVATQGIEDSVEKVGWSAPDCGRRTAYRARPGLEVVCAVRSPAGAGRREYVVATMGQVPGRVSITRYHRPTSGP